MVSNITDLAVSTVNALKAIEADDLGDEKSRLAVLDAARELIARLETPSEQAIHLSFDHPVIFAAVQVLVDVGVWEGWKSSGGGAKGVEELTRLAHLSIDVGLLRRLFRLLAAANIVTEVGEDTFEPTALSLGLGDKDGDIWKIIQAGSDHFLDSGRHLPAFLRETQYKETTDPESTAYRRMPSNPDGLDFFARCQSNPGYGQSFRGYMDAWTRYKQDWTNTLDIKTIMDGADLTQGPLVVDMGGQHGIDLARLLQKEPDLPAGVLILQDLPEVIETAGTKGLDPRIATQVFDLFKPQPVHNSRAYFFHAVLHDWPDDAVLQILENLKPAMKKGYSKLLVADMVLPATGASLSQTTMDVSMMTFVAALDRSERHWTELLTKAGFTKIKFHHDGVGLEAVIVADLI